MPQIIAEKVNIYLALTTFTFQHLILVSFVQNANYLQKANEMPYTEVLQEISYSEKSF